MKRLLCFFLLVYVTIPTAVFSQGDGKQTTTLPKKLHTSVDKILDDSFADIEQALIQQEKLDPREVLLVTVPLENYIEDILFTINRPAVIYPEVIFIVLRDMYRQGKSKTDIEQALIVMQKNNQFRKLYEAKQAQ